MTPERLFPEREIIFRTSGRVRFVRLSSALQQVGVGGVAVTLGAVAWLAAAHLEVGPVMTTPSDPVSRAQEADQAATASLADTPPQIADAATAVVDDHGERLATLERRLAESEAERRRVAAERDRLEAERQRLAAATTAMEKRVKGTLAAQQEAIAQLIARAKTALERASRNLSRLGLEPDKLLAAEKSRSRGVGGPFIEFQRAARGQPTHASLVTLGDKLGRLTELRRAMQMLPIGAPVPNYQIASPFGVRRDPFNGHLAIHNGLDMAVPFGTEVKVRTAGKVTHAGPAGVYGNLVEIDHGFGVRTRYGHLSRVLVRQGQAVTARTTVGLVGSTGRSTAPHLHYEVLFNGKVLDPRKFVEAKQHVFQN